MDCEQQLLPCGRQIFGPPISGWLHSYAEGGRRRYWLRLNPVSSISSCCSPTRSTHRNDSGELRTAHFPGTSKPLQRCSFTACGTGSAPSTKW